MRNMHFMSLGSIRAKLLKTIHLPQICFYCGEPADNKEHVFPKSVYGENTPKVWSCLECNVLAGNNLFSNIFDKRHYIQQKLKIKYKRLLKPQKSWDDEEISELGKNMRTKVIAHQRMIEWIKNRVNWDKSVNALIAAKIIQEIENGKDFAAAHADVCTTKMREIRLLLTID